QGLSRGWQGPVKLSSGVDAELREHFAQVPLDCAPADEQLSSYLRVGVPVPGEPGDLRLLGSELVGRIDYELERGIAGGEQFTPGPLRESLDAHRGQHVVGGPQLVAGVRAAALAAQPLAVEQVCAGQFRADSGAAEPLDRLAVLQLSRL